MPVEIRPLPVILVAAVLAAAAAAVVHSSSNNDAAAKSASTAQATTPISSEPSDPHANGAALPPNHPPIGSGAPMMGGGEPEVPAIKWTAPSAFASAPSTSSMRLATYKIAAAPGDTEEAELSVIRAGGTTEANLDRWVRQFDDAGKETKTEKTIAGFKVTMIEVTGTYLGGGMSPMGAPEPKKGWALLGAIVETSGSPYFFKMVGPAATVKKAHDGFVSMIEGIAKAP